MILITKPHRQKAGRGLLLDNPVDKWIAYQLLVPACN